jgi:peptidoglycan/LPS O-acetylase OafA/YrhL
MDQSIRRNAAFLCGAAGAAMGVFGSSFVALFLPTGAVREAMSAALNWLIPVWLLLLIGLMLGLWPALDYLLNRRPTTGALVAAGIGLGMQTLGIAAIVGSESLGFVGWFAAAGGLLLLLGGLLGRAGDGTDPLTWETLR